MVPCRPLLNFVGLYNAPDGSRRRGLLSNDSSPGSTGAGAGGGLTPGSPGASSSPALLSELSVSSAVAAAAARGSYPAWCAKTKWRTELVPRGLRLLPADLFGAMVDTGARRGVKRR